jgi:hypothetical protein
MTRRIRDRERLKRETEDSKRVLEQARRPPGQSGKGAPPWPKPGKREAPGKEPQAKH